MLFVIYDYCNELFLIHDDGLSFFVCYPFVIFVVTYSFRCYLFSIIRYLLSMIRHKVFVVYQLSSRVQG